MSISYVASTTSSALSNTSRDVGDPAGTQENDFYIVVCSIKDDANAGAWATPADWTKLDEQHYSTLGSSDLLTAVFYRRRGGTAVGNTSFSTTSPTNNISVTLSAYRGVDTTTPFDVAYVTASHYTNHLNNPTAANRAITTVTNGALVVLVWTGNGDNTLGTAGAPSGYALDLTFNDRNHSARFLASKTVATGGSPETPGVWTHATFDEGADTQLYTLALRPAIIASSLYPDMEPLYYGTTRLDSKSNIEYSVWLGTAFNTEPDSSGVNGTTNASGVFQFPGAGFSGVATDPVVVGLYWTEGSDPVVDRSLIVKTTLVAE